MASTREDEEAVLLPRSENNGSSNGSSNDGTGSVGAGPRSPDIQRNGSKAVTRQRREWPTKVGSKKSLKRTLLLLGLVVALITSGVINSILMKMTSDLYTQRFAFFVDQGNNIVYLAIVAVMVAYKLCFTKDITPAQLAFPQYKFFIMACMDGLGTFFTFLGSVYTPGQYQTLLNQTLIPLTMIVAFILLRTRYSRGEVGGAVVVVVGASLAVIPAVAAGHSVAAVRWWAVLLYFASNIPMACSSVYKEMGFKDVHLDVYYLTTIVSVYQVIISFALAPLQSVPGFGTVEGIPQASIWSDLWKGTECAFGKPQEGVDCRYAGLMLVGMSAVNVTYNVAVQLGLVLTKVGSDSGSGAVLCSIAYALKVPVTNLVFAWPLVMGKSVEPLTPLSVSGLGVVMVGFVAYMLFARRRTQHIKARAKSVTEEEVDEAMEPWGFHDRVVGVQASGATAPLLEKVLTDKAT